MKFTIVGLLVVILLVVTNPSEQQHREAIRGKLSEGGLMSAIVGGAVGSRITEYRSLVLVSYTMLDQQLTSVGGLGMVRVVVEARHP